MFTSKIENLSKFLADVDAYISNHSKVSLEELIQSMQELGHRSEQRIDFRTKAHRHRLCFVPNGKACMLPCVGDCEES